MRTPNPRARLQQQPQPAATSPASSSSPAGSSSPASSSTSSAEKPGQQPGQEQPGQQQPGGSSTAVGPVNFGSVVTTIAVAFITATASECMDCLGLDGTAVAEVLRSVADQIEPVPM